MASLVYVFFLGGPEGHWLLRARGIEYSTASTQGSLSQVRSFPWHPCESLRKDCHCPQVKSGGLEKVLSSPHIPCPALSSPLSKAKLGKAEGNRAIHFHRIYHLLNRQSLCGQGVIYISSGWTDTATPGSRLHSQASEEGPDGGRAAFDISLITYCTIRSI
jgi:hypothetical protein